MTADHYKGKLTRSSMASTVSFCMVLLKQYMAISVAHTYFATPIIANVPYTLLGCSVSALMLAYAHIPVPII